MTEQIQAEKKPAKKVKPKNNIDGLDALKKEFLGRPRRMSDEKSRAHVRKRDKLLQRLEEIKTDGKLTDDEKELFVGIMKKLRIEGHLHRRLTYVLNEYELEDKDVFDCVVATDDAPNVHRLNRNTECKAIYDGDIKMKGQETAGAYVVYVPRVIGTREQLSRDVVVRENLGHPVDPSEYPKQKTKWHRIVINPKEFAAWFDSDEEIHDNDDEYEF